jgi:hypothetical protein
LPKVDVAAMAESALDQLAQVVAKGFFQTPAGKAVTLDQDQHVRVLQWAAMQRERKPKILDSPDDLDLKPTRGSHA